MEVFTKKKLIAYHRKKERPRVIIMLKSILLAILTTRSTYATPMKYMPQIDSNSASLSSNTILRDPELAIKSGYDPESTLSS